MENKGYNTNYLIYLLYLLIINALVHFLYLSKFLQQFDGWNKLRFLLYLKYLFYSNFLQNSKFGLKQKELIKIVFNLAKCPSLASDFINTLPNSIKISLMISVNVHKDSMPHLGIDTRAIQNCRFQIPNRSAGFIEACRNPPEKPRLQRGLCKVNNLIISFRKYFQFRANMKMVKIFSISCMSAMQFM